MHLASLLPEHDQNNRLGPFTHTARFTPYFTRDSCSPIQCLALGVLVWSAITLQSASLENNEYAGISSGGVTTELRAAYSGTSAVLRYLMGVACVVLVLEIAAMVVQIVVRCLELQEYQCVSLVFHIPVSQ